jgi:hypothetical protein
MQEHSREKWEREGGRKLCRAAHTIMARKKRERERERERERGEKEYLHLLAFSFYLFIPMDWCHPTFVVGLLPFLSGTMCRGL